jgi:hypothetical protein
MLTPDDFSYALENTQVLVAPKRRLETFNSTFFNYCLLTEEMDAVNVTRIREGQIHAERPQILSPHYMARLLLEGFGPEGERFARHLSSNPIHGQFLRYGFFFRKAEVRHYDVHESLESVSGRLKEEVEGKNDPLMTLLKGVDVGWEVCLLKVMVDLVTLSASGNATEFRDRGLL